ncbi:hypothetical protein MTR67_028849 [Solanum verrucosum]|uniref:Uncharacterized protein n=1 Tax=Solanum verrucosum TaxID=315347 RepID=A0AAF0RBX2_SOLVR|nr:hypothetical protein MTR67_028849 [Solanum verrucosum]
MLLRRYSGKGLGRLIMLIGTGRLLFKKRAQRIANLGTKNYLTVTRPDISFHVSVVSQFMTSPCDSHWDAVVRILRYIKSAPGKGLLIEDQGHEHITRFTDADWAGSPYDRRSTSGLF